MSFRTIAQRVFDAVVQLDLDDFNAGPRVTGYVEPSEAAREAIERAVAPYFNDLKRRMALRHLDEATEIAKGIVVGLYRAERHGFELLDTPKTVRQSWPAARLRSSGGDARGHPSTELHREVRTGMGLAQSLTSG